MKDHFLRIHNFELMQNGNKIPMKNIDDYINKRILFMYGIYEPFIQKIREGIFTIIVKEKLQMFYSEELELILNGKPNIDLND